MTTLSRNPALRALAPEERPRRFGEIDRDFAAIGLTVEDVERIAIAAVARLIDEADPKTGGLRGRICQEVGHLFVPPAAPIRDRIRAGASAFSVDKTCARCGRSDGSWTVADFGRVNV